MRLERGEREGRGNITHDRGLHLVACSLDPNRAQIESQLGDLLPTLYFAIAQSVVN